MVAKEGVWPGLFGEFFMGVSVEENENCEAQDKSDDDMLFYVQNKPHSSDNEVINDMILLKKYYARENIAAYSVILHYTWLL